MCASERARVWAGKIRENACELCWPSTTRALFLNHLLLFEALHFHVFSRVAPLPFLCRLRDLIRYRSIFQQERGLIAVESSPSCECSNRTVPNPWWRWWEMMFFPLFALLLISSNYTRLGESVCFYWYIVYLLFSWMVGFGAFFKRKNRISGENDRAQGLQAKEWCCFKGIVFAALLLKACPVLVIPGMFVFNLN